MCGIAGFFGVAGIAYWRKHHTPPPTPITPAVTIVPAVPKYPDPPGIVIHHSESPAVVGKIAINAARLEAIHKKRGFGIDFEGKKYHIAYHYVILPDGTIEKGRPDYCEGSHAPTFNHWLGIVLIGQFSSKDRHHWYPATPTKAQLKSLLILCEDLMSRYHIPPALVKRHRDVTMTYCPGDRFPYDWLIAQLKGYAAVHPETTPTDGRSLVVEKYIPPKLKAKYAKRAEEERKRQEALRRRRSKNNG